MVPINANFTKSGVSFSEQVSAEIFERSQFFFVGGRGQPSARQAPRPHHLETNTRKGHHSYQCQGGAERRHLTAVRRSATDP
ncbi:hypothetical protein E2C01_050271 [Portunus trituberculatus]|uniref:Uncharacterized protein n=1 Tax=Portunus trituberculatus TaxID=210409 RepID=A0A5B7GGU9_PORTR|nr:hypothetical protein [Portunus trituberculatus]